MLQPDPHQFNETGDCFSLHDPRLLRRADFDLWNDSFTLKVDHTGRAEGRVYTPNAQPYAESLRAVYCQDRDSGEAWSLCWGPVFQDPPVFSFDIRLDHVSWLQEYAGIASELSVAVPRGAALEAWRLVIGNQTAQPRRLRIIPAFPTGLLGLLSHESRLVEQPFGLLHEYFPYYVKIPDYERMARRWNTTFFFAGREPSGWTALEGDFLGFAGWAAPEALQRDRLDGRACHYQRGLCACEHEVTLRQGETLVLGWTFGPARDAEHALQLRAAYPPDRAFSAALAEQAAFRREQRIPLRVTTPDVAFNHYINHWSPDRSIRIGRTFRFNPAPQARNAIQDTMTLALFDPAAARERFLAVWRHQDPDGFMPHGLPMVAEAELMPITLIPHKDTNVWGPLALDLYLRETNDTAFLAEPVPYTDGSTGTLAGHLERGLEWLLRERSQRGLSLIGQGDWNDPLNMAGPEGKGESVWLTEALALALQLWAGIAEKTGGDPARWLAAAEECRESVRCNCWDGDWFLRATSDDGHPIGSRACAHGAIYLNAQSWAIMAGIPDAGQIETLIRSVNARLGTRIAPALLQPPYPGMVRHVGKLTLKSPGTGENGSVYSHAALFWSYALFHCGRADEGWRVLRNLLPGGPDNPVEAAGQVPLYIPNFYRGPVPEDSFGRSSHSPNTGSAAWVYLTFIEKVVGLRGEGDHLRVQPQLPTGWDKVSGERVFRGTVYRFTIERQAGAAGLGVSLNGRPASPRIPWQPASEPQDLRIVIP